MVARAGPGGEEQGRECGGPFPVAHAENHPRVFPDGAPLFWHRCRELSAEGRQKLPLE